MRVALATTGPVGNPVGEPPIGSSEMANVVPGSIGAGERASASTLSPASWNSPSGCGAPVPTIAHNCALLPAGIGIGPGIDKRPFALS